MKKIGLALGGGGARGISHLGVLRAMSKNNIPVHFIAGTSMGAMIGACYAFNPDIDNLNKVLGRAFSSSLFKDIRLSAIKGKDNDKTFFRKAKNLIKEGYKIVIERTAYSMIDISKLEELVGMIVPDADFSETALPFACVATNLSDGCEKVFTEDSLRQAVMASSAVPGIFPPVKIKDDFYDDGGFVNLTPVSVAKKLGADIVVACWLYASGF